MSWKDLIGKKVLAKDFSLKWEDLAGPPPKKNLSFLDFLPYDVDDNFSNNPYRTPCGHCYACKSEKGCNRSWDYELYLIGHDLAGRKTVVVIRGIQPYFDISVPKDQTAKSFEKSIQQHYSSGKIKKYEKTEIVKYEVGDRYVPEPVEWVRIYFQNKNNRDKEMKNMQSKHRCMIGSPLPRNQYATQVCADNNLSFTSWLRIDNPKPCKDGRRRVKLNIDFYETTLEKIRRVPKEEYTEYHKNPWSLIVAFDNENQSPDGSFPRPATEKRGFNGRLEYNWDETTNSRLTMVGFSLAWRNECKKPFLSFTINDRDVEPNDDMITIICDTPTEPPSKTELEIQEVLSNDTMKARLGADGIIKLEDRLKELVSARRKRNYDAAEKNLILTFARIMKELSPSLHITYNGSTFDWPWIVVRAYQYGIVLDIYKTMSVFRYKSDELSLSGFKRWTFRSSQKKLDATNTQTIFELRMPGMVHIDLMMYLFAVHQKDNDHSLNAMLRRYKLGGKDDIKPDDIFTIFSESDILLDRLDMEDTEYVFEKPNVKETSKRLSELSHYCAIDCVRTLQLLGKGSFLAKMLQWGDMTFTSYRECWMKADGAKCGYVIRDQAKRKGMLFSDFIISTGGKKRHPGATVLRPDRVYGTVPLRPEEREELLKTHKPADLIPEINKSVLNWLRDPNNKPKKIRDIYREFKEAGENCDLDAFMNTLGKILDLPITLPLAALDFASLYPSIMRAFNISPDTMAYSQEEADEAIKAGRKVRKFEEVIYEVDDSKKPVAAWKEEAWLIQHEWKCAEPQEVKDPKTGKTRLENEAEMSPRDIKPFDLGTVPRVLDEVFSRRVIKKRELKKLKQVIEKMVADGQEKLDKFREISFEASDVDSIQYALKIFMNTMYGILRYLSRRGILQSAAVTHYGRECLDTAKTVLEQLGCHIYYGDTDSTYFQMPAHEYKDLILEYYGDPDNGVPGVGTRKEFATKLVNRTFELIKYYQNFVNLYFIRKLGVRFINMSYEEVLYPYAFVRKKRYAGRQHDGIPNFGPWNKHTRFTRGFDCDKRNASDILKVTFEEFFERIFDIDNVLAIRPHVERGIRECFLKAQPSKAREFGLTPWTTETFVKNVKYRPPKAGKRGNICVLNFVEKLRKERGHRIVPNQTLQYVRIKLYPWTYDYYKGNQSELASHDYMMLVSDYNADIESGKEIALDIDKYSEAVISQFAPLLSNHPDFAEPVPDFIPIDLSKYDAGQSVPLNLLLTVQEHKYSDAIGVADKRVLRYLQSVAEKYSPSYQNKSSLIKSVCTFNRNTLKSRLEGRFGKKYWQLTENIFNKNDLKFLLRSNGKKTSQIVQKCVTDLTRDIKHKCGKDYLLHIGAVYNPDARYNYRVLMRTILGRMIAKASREYDELKKKMETCGLSKEGFSDLNKGIISYLGLEHDYEEQGMKLPEIKSVIDKIDRGILNEYVDNATAVISDTLIQDMITIISRIKVIREIQEIHGEMHALSEVENTVTQEIIDNVADLIDDITV